MKLLLFPLAGLLILIVGVLAKLWWYAKRGRAPGKSDGPADADAI